jgi:hypothetical protein
MLVIRDISASDPGALQYIGGSSIEATQETKITWRAAGPAAGFNVNLK